MAAQVNDPTAVDLLRRLHEAADSDAPGMDFYSATPLCREVQAFLDAQEKPKVKEGCCHICGEPMPPGEEMFNYHGYSGPCPKDIRLGSPSTSGMGC